MRLAPGFHDSGTSETLGAWALRSTGAVLRAFQRVALGRSARSTVPAAMLEGTELIHLSGGETLACPGAAALPLARSAKDYGLGSSSLALPSAKVHRLRNVRVVARQRVLISADGALISECLTGDMAATVRVPASARRRPDQHLDGVVAVYRSPWPAQYHTLVDHLPRAALLAQPALRRFGLITLLHDGELTEMESLLLPRLLPARVRLHQIDPDAVISADSVLLPSYVTRPAAGAIPGWYRRWVDREAAAIHAEVHDVQPHRYPRRFFVERRETRRIRNRAAFDALLAEHDVATVDPNEMSAAEIVACYQGANLVIGVTGSGLANTLFCRKAKVIELLAGPEMLPHFFYLATSKGLAYDFVATRTDDTRRSARERLNDDVEVDLDALDALLAV